MSERHNILFTDTRDAHSLYDNQHGKYYSISPFIFINYFTLYFHFPTLVLSPPLIHISAQASQSDFLKRDVIDSSRFGIQQQMTIPSIPSERGVFQH